MYATKPSVTAVDLEKYSGKWYVLACIPTEYDKSRNYICEQYKVSRSGKIEIETSYFEDGTSNQSVATAVGFPEKESNNVKWKVQYVWPFKSDYLIEELDNDYSHAVVGHPQRKFLYIMNRTGRMSEDLFIDLLTRCGRKGYDLTRLRKVPQ